MLDTILKIIKNVLDIIKGGMGIVNDVKSGSSDTNSSSKKVPVKRYSMRVVKKAASDVVKQISKHI